MEKNLIYSLMLSGMFLLLFGIAEILYHRFQLAAEHSRKLVHVGTGILSLLFPLLFSHWIWVLFLCATFLLLLWGSIRFRLLQSIHAVDRPTVGSLAFPGAVFGSYMAYYYADKNLLFYYLPILILAISDPLAALFGKRFPIGKYILLGAKKTLLGSLFFFCSAGLIAWLAILYGSSVLVGLELFLMAFGIAFLATLAEAMSRNGYDNISIPFAVLLGLSCWL